MKAKIITLAILVLLTACSKKSTDTPITKTTPPTAEPIVWFFGDSMTQGVGASNLDHRWTTVLSVLKKWDERNYGTSYESLLKASENTGYTSFFTKYQTAILAKQPKDKYIFIAYGGNDCAFNFADYTPELYATQLQTIITFANSKGWTNSSIVVMCGYFENEYSWSAGYGGQAIPIKATMARYFSFIAAAQTVASNNTGVYFVNPFNCYDATGLADGLHANDAGHTAIANYVASLIP